MLLGVTRVAVATSAGLCLFASSTTTGLVVGLKSDEVTRVYSSLSTYLLPGILMLFTLPTSFSVPSSPSCSSSSSSSLK
ncbi:hypothetical protein BDZ91DRAFT_727163 [Kalaharituber pfeilii]|nr:hypothetical protein BDZ91DRAFT_727163 [Kalaharituber pfeilii]